MKQNLGVSYYINIANFEVFLITVSSSTRNEISKCDSNFYKVWHVWRSSNLLELPLIFVTLSQKKNLMLERAFLSAFLVVKNTRLQLPLFE